MHLLSVLAHPIAGIFGRAMHTSLRWMHQYGTLVCGP